MASLEIRIETNVDEVAAVIDRLAGHFETAADDDPARRAMAAFGEIDAACHLPMTTRYESDRVRVTFSLDPELQRIADMLPT